MLRRTVLASRFLICLLLSGNLYLVSILAQPVSSRQAATEGLQPDTIAARKAALHAQIDALAKTQLSKEDLEKAQQPLQQMLQILSAVEAALHTRATYMTYLDSLPQQLRDVEAEHQAWAARPPPSSASVTEQLRDQHETQLQAAWADMQEVLTQTTQGQIRLTIIPQELERRSSERRQLLQRLSAAQHPSSPLADPLSSGTEAQGLDFQLQLLDADVQSLEAERQWLSSQGPLQDARLRLAQTRLNTLQQELAGITQALGTSIEHEQATLSRAAADLEQQLAQATDPIASMRLTVSLETIRIRRRTAELRYALNQISDAVLAQEKRNTQEKQDVDRLASLVEKYSSGEGVAQRLLLSFERLRRARIRYRDAALKEGETHLRILSEQMFEADDRLYGFDPQVETRLLTLQKELSAATTRAQARDLAAVRQAFGEQKTAWREQQQVLSALVQDQTRLLALHRDYKRLLDDSYLFVLTKMFWLRDGERLSLSVLQTILTSAVRTVNRFQDFAHAEWSDARLNLATAVHLWLLALLLFCAAPWLLATLRARLRQRIVAALAATVELQTPPGLAVLALILLQSALWPAYLMLLAWSYGLFLPRSTAPLALALVAGLQVGALILCMGYLGRAMLRRNGWGQQFWGLSTELCHFLWHAILVGDIAALLFLVPRHILLSAPGDAEMATGSIALARFLLLAFQTVFLALIGIVGRRGSALMQTVLARSRQQEGLWWRIWPFIYLVLLVGMGTIIMLDVLGYHYAAQFVWLRTLESFSVLILRRLLVALLVLHLLHGLVNILYRAVRRTRQQGETLEATVEHFFHIAYAICNALLLLLAAGIILELWGIPVSWLLTTHLGMEALSRATIIALTIGVTVFVIQISTILTEYLIRPKINAPGMTHATNRKLRTMAPLIQTVLKVGVIFAAVLVVLEQLNIATGPILTGVGIFGLAVGFASQSLIKDVINGLFILFEDSLLVGDVVTLRGITGSVEKVTLRAVTIRDLAGGVHVIPNSTLDMITNLTKDFGRYLLDVSVAYREDVDAVIALLRDIDTDMRNDPAYGWDMLEPLEVMGLQQFADSAVVIRARLKTTAGQQWRLGREFNRRMKKVFDERGIEIPFPHRTLYWGMPKDGAQAPLPVAFADRQPTPPADGKASQAQIENNRTRTD